MNDTFPHDTSGCAASADTVRGCSGSTVGPSGSHYIIAPLQKTSGPRKKQKTAISHFWYTHQMSLLTSKRIAVVEVWKAECTTTKWIRYLIGVRRGHPKFTGLHLVFDFLHANLVLRLHDYSTFSSGSRVPKNFSRSFLPEPVRGAI